MRARFVAPPASFYINYYKQQRGGSLPYFHGSVYGQRGSGFGSIFAKLLGRLQNLWTRTPQWIKTGAKLAAKQAGTTGMDIAGDAVRAKSAEEFHEQARKRVKQGAGQLLTAAGEKMQQQGKGIKRPRQSSVQKKKNKKKRQTPAIKRIKADFFGTI